MKGTLSIFLACSLLQGSPALSLGGNAAASGQTDLNTRLGLNVGTSELGNLLSSIGLNLGANAGGKSSSQGKGKLEEDAYANLEGEADAGLSDGYDGKAQTQGNLQAGLTVGGYGNGGASSRPTYNRPTGQAGINAGSSLQAGGSESYRPQRPTQSGKTQAELQAGLKVGGSGQSRPTYNRPYGQTGANAGLSGQAIGSGGAGGRGQGGLGLNLGLDGSASGDGLLGLGGLLGR